MQEIAKMILLDMDDSLEIDNASCVDEGLSKLATGNYDVIISDYEMPQKDGLQFLMKLREQNNEIPFILFTGKGREEVAIKALNQGANGYRDKQGSPETVYGELAHSIHQCVEHYKAKQNLIKSENKYSYLFSNMLNGFAHCKMIFDKKNKPVDWVYLEVNNAFTKLTGLKKEAVIGKKVTDAIPGIEKTNPELFEIYGRVASTGKEEQFDIFFDPVKAWLSVSVYSPEKNYFIALFENISERKNAEEKLKGTFEVLEKVGESIDAGLAVIGNDYRVVWANKRLMALGVAPNKKCYQTFNHSENVCVDCGAKRIFEQNLPLDVHEFKTVNSKGETTWIELRVTPLKDKDGKVIAALELAVPINERKKAEQELQAKESKYRDIFNNSEVGMFRTRLDGSEIFDFNDKYLSILGLTREEINGRSSVSFWADPLERQEMVRLLKANGQVKDFECKLINKRHEIIQCLTSVKLYTEQNMLEGSIQDITEHKKTEESLEKDQQELNRIIDSSPIIIFYKDKEGKFIRVNEAFAKAQKIPKEKFLGKTVFDFYSTEIAQSMTNDDLEVLKSGHPRLGIIEPYESANGIRWVQTDKVPTLDKDGIVTGLVGFAQDITERREAEEALQESESKFRMYVENSPVSVFVADSEGKYLYVNAAATRLLGYSAKEFMRMEIRQIVFNEDLSAILTDFVALQETGQILKELRLKNKDGQAVYISLNAVKLPDGKLIGFCENVTERKKAEESLNGLMDELVRVNEKLGVVGGLTRHDVRNKLSAVTGYAYLLKKRHGDQADIVEGLGKMELAIAESVKIFDFAKMYEQIGVEKLTFINVENTLNEALMLFSGSLNVKVINECHGLTVLADSFLRQLFFNLMDNSVKHGEKVKEIRVRYEMVDQDKLILIYEDDGIGIPVDNKSKLFKIGFSTGGSSGYGLYLIRRMIDVYGWAIKENGVPGAGAKFTITVPKINQNGKENFQVV